MGKKPSLEKYFAPFRENIIGNQQCFESPFGEKEIVYADWTASGKAYRPIEDLIQNQILPFMANTHTGSTITGSRMTAAYEEAKAIVKKHVHARLDDVLIFCGSGMTGAVNKLQRILGLRIPEYLKNYFLPDNFRLDEALRPVVFLSHMEHHSNQISWLETIAIVELIAADGQGQPDISHFKQLLIKYKDRKQKILSITACSNVTGIETPYHAMAKIIHEHNGFCFVDFACSAPYSDMNMHPAEDGTHLDAIYFSPHKFLGGPGSAGVLIFNQKINDNKIPDQPGGGTVLYSNPWKEHEYINQTEQREDGGTPPILQGIRVAMCIRLKEKMGVVNLLKREEELVAIIFNRLSKIKNLEILAGENRRRLGIVSFIVRDAPYNLIVKILNDRFGIQTRGGCSCAGTYGHALLRVSKRRSYEIRNRILSGDLSAKPGWIRLSMHPTMTNHQIEFIADAIEISANHFPEWMKDYNYNAGTNEYSMACNRSGHGSDINSWFNIAT